MYVFKLHWQYRSIISTEHFVLKMDSNLLQSFPWESHITSLQMHGCLPELGLLSPFLTHLACCVFSPWNIPSSFSEPGSFFLSLECSFPQLCVYFTWFSSMVRYWLQGHLLKDTFPEHSQPLSLSIQYLTLCKSLTTPCVSYLRVIFVIV